jgi:peptide-methionine (R)-S-oxide reductase
MEINMTTTRRVLLARSAALLGAASMLTLAGCTPAVAQEAFEVTHSDAEWRRILSPAAYNVMRHEDTERAGSSPLDAEERMGAYHCAGCDLPLFSSDTKFHSGTGWPSFWKPLDKAVAEKRDNAFGMVRIEVHCRRCGGHLGHVFDDGPMPTGLRYCMNGVSLRFKPA